MDSFLERAVHSFDLGIRTSFRNLGSDCFV